MNSATRIKNDRPDSVIIKEASSLKVYLAGPEVFLPDAVAIGRRKQALCRRHGFEGLYPFDNDLSADDGERVDRLIYRANKHMIEQADFAIMNLTPFRGPSADVGTAFELGMLAALRKPVFGYTNVDEPMHARIPGSRQRADGGWVDPDGFTVENFGNAENLMVDCCLAEGINAFVRREAGGRLDDLRGFEVCLQLATQRLGSLVL